MKNESGPFPIVGIGASAGGLEALEQFFGNMPGNTGMAFVVIQHLDPNHVGIMPELLQRITPMNVFQASDGHKVKRNCVYVIPPNKSLSLLHGSLHLFDPVESRGLRLPVDYFFRSLANDRQEKSIGIILSGMGSDGSLGLTAIKEKFGIVLVQDPASAKFDGMPRSAIDSVIADIVAPASELPAKLLAFLKHVPTLKTDPDMDQKAQSSLEKIIILLREQLGHDFSKYKKNALFRRIDNRKSIHQIDKIQHYVRYLQENPGELDILFKELLIGVTSFFRDSEVWKKMKEEVFPAIIKESPNGHILRAWVTACSTGEEAFSLAIVFQEALEKVKERKNITLQIFATDIDQQAIEHARRGCFIKNISADVSPERLSRFFKEENDGYSVISALREMVVFAPQNIIKDPPFTRLDIITCRNLLIYFEPVLQKKVLNLFNYSLKDGGILLLGSAENVGNKKEGFDDVDERLKIFRRTVSIFNQHVDFPSSFSRMERVEEKKLQSANSAENIQNLTEQIILQRFTPASVLVNDQGDILFITGRTGKYLEPATGRITTNIYAMAREGLREVLPDALRKAMQNFNPVTIRSIKVGTNGEAQFVDITVQRIENPDTIRGMILIVFTDIPDAEPDPAEMKGRKRKSTQRLTELETKLQRSYEDQQSTREEMQASQEELKSTNEEMQSTNEELQSTNEELTTSKEEMQSLNEELQSVNVELQIKISDFIQANNDMKNLLNSTEIATLFLDRDLNIRRFTDSMTEIIKLRKTDVGRPFTELASWLLYPEIERHALEVLDTLIPVETTIATHDGRWFVARTMPYRTIDYRIDGLVMTFSDITAAKKLVMEVKLVNDALAISETRYRRLFETSQDGILILDAETGLIQDVNPFLIKLLGYAKEQFLEKAIWEIGLFKDVVANKSKFLELQQKEFVRYENLPLETADGRKINVEFISNVYSVNDIRVIQCQIRDLTGIRQQDSKR